MSGKYLESFPEPMYCFHDILLTTFAWVVVDTAPYAAKHCNSHRLLGTAQTQCEPNSLTMSDMFPQARTILRNCVPQPKQPGFQLRSWS